MGKWIKTCGRRSPKDKPRPAGHPKNALTEETVEKVLIDYLKKEKR